MRTIWLASAAALGIFASGAQALAQTVPPGATRPPTREELGQLRQQQPARGGEVSVIDDDIERAPCPFSETRFASVNFVLTDAVFSGLRSVPPELVRPAYADRLGQTVAITELCDIRDRAATLLRRAGYVAAVQIPDQRIEQGTARFDVLVARLVGIEFADGKGDPLIARTLGKLREQELFNRNDAERYLLLARDLPGYDVRLTLKPAGTEPGDVIGLVTVTRTPVTGGLTLHNLGSRAVGREAGLASVQFNGLTGAGSQTSVGLLSTFNTREQNIVQLGHAMRVGPEGLTLGLEGSYAVTRPSSRPPIPLRAESLILTGSASYPLKRSEAENVILGGGLDWIDQDITFFRTEVLSRDRLRVAFLRLDYDRIDRRGTSAHAGQNMARPAWHLGFRLEARQGLDLGASERCRPFVICDLSRGDADPTTFVLRGNGVAEFDVAGGFGLAFAPSFQISANPLLAFEEYAIGTFTTGRGYDPGALTGDKGVGLRSELRLPSIALGTPARSAIQPFAFFDYGAAWNRGFTGRDFKQELYSTGGGLRASLGERMRLEVAVAAPLKRAPLEDDRKPRVLVTLTSNLIPWRR